MRKGMLAVLALAAMLATVAGVWWSGRPVPVRAPSLEDVAAEAEAGGYRLLSTAEVAALAADGRTSPLLVDTRQPWEFRTGHIPGSVNFSMEPTAWARLTSRWDLAALLGPDKARSIVFY